MSLDNWHHEGPCKPSSCTTFTLNSHWGKTATGKKKVLYVHWVASVLSDSMTLWTMACQVSLSGRGVLQTRILEHIG